MTAGYGKGPDIITSCSINVNKGEIVAILGPNGAGKSTAMKAMLGLLNLKSGSIVLNEKDISITVDISEGNSFLNYQNIGFKVYNKDNSNVIAIGGDYLIWSNSPNNPKMN